MTHVISTTDPDSPYYVCAHCRLPVCKNNTGGVVTILGGNPECYGKREENAR